jgi:hypothetical protein
MLTDSKRRYRSRVFYRGFGLRALAPIAGGANATTVASVPGVGGPQSTTVTAAQTQIAFNQASHRGTELSQTYAGVQLGGAALGTNTVTVGNGPISLFPQGFIRGVLVDIMTSTAANSGTGNGDFPFSLVNLMRLHDTNGATMHEHTGFHNYLLNLAGSGVDANVNDLSQWPDYSASATSPSVQYYLPVELDANGFGALANQSAADTYKLDLVLDSPANVYSTPPSTSNPIFTVNIHVDYWTLPGSADMLGRPQQQEPPYHGVAQYTYQSNTNGVAAGQQTLKIGYTGNMYRALILTGRSSGTGYATGGPRAAGILPNPYTLRYDTRDLMIGTTREQRRQFYTLLDNPGSPFLTGVYMFLWNYGSWKNVGGPGFQSWLPTLPATRFELTGTFGAGTVDMLSNTVSVAETNPALRGVSPSATGYSPPVAATVQGAQ